MSKPLSPAQERMLKSIRRAHDPLATVFGRSAHGGATKTLASLQRAKLIVWDPWKCNWWLTAAGRNALRTGRVEASDRDGGGKP